MGKLENLKPFEPGQSGNPNGRPPGTKSLSTILRNMLEEEIPVSIDGALPTKKKFKEILLRRLLKAANDGDVRAINTIFDRVDGKAQQFIEMTVPGGINSDSTHTVIFKDLSEAAKTTKAKAPAKKPRKKK